MRRAIGAVTVATAGVVALLAGRRLAEKKSIGSSTASSLALMHLPAALEAERGLWRGPAPDEMGYRELAAAGVSLVVDLRREADGSNVREITDRAGVELLLLPVRDASSPTLADLDAFALALDAADGITYVHCRAGEGRTGAIVGAHQVRQGTAVARASAEALDIGSLTFAQMAFIATAGRIGRWAKVIDVVIDRPTEAFIQRLT